MVNARLERLKKDLEPYRKKVCEHPIYSRMRSHQDICIFVESHVFAVWDFMSLVKALQRSVTCVETPWLPVKRPRLARFVNEIVLAEESDLDACGEVKSHFQMYYEAMKVLGASIIDINMFLNSVRTGQTPVHAIEKQSWGGNTLDFRVVDFLRSTFEVVESGSLHRIASSFAFGREDMIPEMFIRLLNSNLFADNTYSKLRYYFERHIELDGDEHGPLALELVAELCGENEEYWQEAFDSARVALERRAALWDCICDQIGAYDASDALQPRS